jgi:rhodanese-related sulfurtransferase
MSAVLEAFSRRATGVVSALSHRRLCKLRFSTDRNPGASLRPQWQSRRDEVLAHIQTSHEQDAKLLIAPPELVELRQQDPTVRVVDVRSREEFEAVNIAGSQLFSQEVMRQIMSDGSNTRALVLVDHQGKTAPDAAAYFMGHGLQNVRCLRGGIDAWAQEVETGMRRYKLG